MPGSRSLPASGQNAQIIQSFLAILPVLGCRLLNDLPHIGPTLAARFCLNERDNFSCTIRDMQTFRRPASRLGGHDEVSTNAPACCIAAPQ